MPHKAAMLTSVTEVATEVASALRTELEDSGCLDFPSFEAYDAEDRPPPPPVEDYPIGCEVELVDIDPARVAQTNELWQPFMDTLFGQGRRSVRVVRHQGDYTFVICDANPDLVIGCTLYRACLGEPKVRFKKYIPSHNKDGSATSMSGSIHNSVKRGFYEVHAFSGEGDVRGRECPLPIVSSVIAGDSFGARNVGTSLTDQPSEAPRLTHTKEARIGEGTNLSEEDARRLKYNYATKMGYGALVKQNYMEAVRYYTKALKYSRDGGARSLSNRSVAFLGLRNVEAAFKDAMRVIDLIPNSFVGYVRAGNTLRGMRRFEEARTYYERALALEPNNEELQYLLSSNSVIMLYASRMEHRDVASILLDRSTMNVILVAKKELQAGDFAWMESTTTLTLLGKRPRNISSIGDGGDSSSSKGIGIRNNSSGGGDKTDNDSSSYVCGLCYRPMTQVQHFCDSMTGIDPSLIHKLYKDNNIVHCNGGCGEIYCSELCRAKAWAAHHWVECESRGKWSEAFSRLPAIFDNFALEYKKGLTNAKCSNVGGNAQQNGGLLPLSDSADVIMAGIRIACRMFSEFVSNGRVLDDAIHMFDWMLPKESKYAKCCRGENGEMSHLADVEKVLIAVYTSLQKCFNSEEKLYLSFERFVHCYERVRFNGVKVRISRWPSIQDKAESYLELFKIQAGENVSTLSQDSLPREASTRRSLDGSHLAQLRSIVETPAESVVGYFECLAVFKVFSATFAPRSLKEEVQGHYNVRLRPSIQPAAVIHIDVTEKIHKGEQMQVDRSVNTLLV